MERSIENIWKEGFEAEDNIQIPLVRDLYRKKSKLIIEKIKSTSRTDNISLIPLAVILAGVFIFLGKAILGFYIATIILLLFLLNRRKLRELNELKLSANTYHYLKAYYAQVKDLQSYYTILLGVGLPLVLLPAYFLYFQDTPQMTFFSNLDFHFQILVAVIASVVLSAIGIFSYRLSTHFLYAKLFTRLEEIINDMEDLMDR